MKGYKAILFAPDGDWVTDYKADTKEEVMEKLADKGSCWYFYPLEGVILNKGAFTLHTQRLLDLDPNFPRELVGKSILTVSKWLSNLSEEEICFMMEGGLTNAY